jgi:hypothetical protein
LDCAYPTPVKRPLDRYRTNEHLWDWSQRQPMSTHEGDWVITAGWISLTHIGYVFWSDAKGYLAVGSRYGSCDSVINTALSDCIS